MIYFLNFCSKRGYTLEPPLLQTPVIFYIKVWSKACFQTCFRDEDSQDTHTHTHTHTHTQKKKKKKKKKKKNRYTAVYCTVHGKDKLCIDSMYYVERGNDKCAVCCQYVEKSNKK